MTSTSTSVSIANRSLLSIGARAQISSLSDGSTEADAISVLFVPTFQALARSASWNCLRKQAVLTLLAAAQGTPENPDGTTLPQPPQPWLYSYAVPSDSLDIRFVIPTFPNFSASGTPPLTPINNLAPTWLPGNDGQIPFVVAYSTDAQNNPIEIILCDQTQAQVVYTVNQPNPVVWDSLFEAAMVASLAAYLVPALSLNIQLMQMSIRTAEQAITNARVRDGDEGVTSVNRNAQWMQARLASGYAWDGYGDSPWNAFTPMVWPAY